MLNLILYLNCFTRVKLVSIVSSDGLIIKTDASSSLPPHPSPQLSSILPGSGFDWLHLPIQNCTECRCFLFFSHVRLVISLYTVCLRSEYFSSRTFLEAEIDQRLGTGPQGNPYWQACELSNNSYFTKNTMFLNKGFYFFLRSLESKENGFKFQSYLFMKCVVLREVTTSFTLVACSMEQGDLGTFP